MKRERWRRVTSESLFYFIRQGKLWPVSIFLFLRFFDSHSVVEQSTCAKLSGSYQTDGLVRFLFILALVCLFLKRMTEFLFWLLLLLLLFFSLWLPSSPSERVYLFWISLSNSFALNQNVPKKFAGSERGLLLSYGADCKRTRWQVDWKRQLNNPVISFSFFCFFFLSIVKLFHRSRLI